MADALLTDRMFQRIMRELIDTGRAPHYAERARALGLGVEEGRLPTCLDCGDPVSIEMRDGRIVWIDPPGVVGHLNYGFGPSRGRPPFL